MSIIWHHVSDTFYEDTECCLNILPKLSNEHINISTRAEAAETACFCLLMMDCFFDIIDIRNIQPHAFEQKTMLATFRFVNHRMFSWLHNVFPKSFQNWLNSVRQHQETLQKVLTRKCSYRGKLANI